MTVRRGTVADADALVELRAALFAAMGEQTGPAGASWRAAAHAWFLREVPDTSGVAVFVAEEPGAGVVACALGVLQRHVPSPNDAAEVTGHVSAVSTFPAFRRRGHARACLTALLDWFDRETAATRVDLNATGDGAALYESLGFAVHRYPAMRRRRPHP